MESIIAQYKQLLQELLDSTPCRLDDRSELPTEGGIYRIFEKGAGWQSSLYIGQSSNLRSRIYQSHLMGNRDVSPIKRKLGADEVATKQYLKDKCVVQFVEVPDETERTYLEHFVVAILRPEYND